MYVGTRPSISSQERRLKGGLMNVCPACWLADIKVPMIMATKASQITNPGTCSWHLVICLNCRDTYSACVSMQLSDEEEQYPGRCDDSALHLLELSSSKRPLSNVGDTQWTQKRKHLLDTYGSACKHAGIRNNAESPHSGSLLSALISPQRLIAM